MRLRAKTRQAGYLITVELILIFTILVIGSLVGVIAVRNAIFKLMTARAQWQIIVKDADDPPLRVKPVSFDLCEAPEILCRDFGFDATNNGMGATPGPSEGLFALVGIRATHLVSRNHVYFANADCDDTGGVFLAPPAVPIPAGSPANFPPDELRPVGYFNCALQVDDAGDNVCYGVGPPSNWECDPLGTGAACADGGRLYRSVGGADDAALTTVGSRWISLNPDCADVSGSGGGGTTSTAICDNFGATDLVLLPAVEVTDMDGINVLAAFTPLFNVMAPDVTEVTILEPGGEGDPPGADLGPITETGQPTLPDGGGEIEPPP